MSNSHLYRMHNLFFRTFSITSIFHKRFHYCLYSYSKVSQYNRPSSFHFYISHV